MAIVVLPDLADSLAIDRKGAVTGENIGSDLLGEAERRLGECSL